MFDNLLFSLISIKVILSFIILCFFLVIIFIITNKYKALKASNVIYNGIKSFAIKSLVKSYEFFRLILIRRPRFYLLIFLLILDIMRPIKGSLVYIYATGKS